MKTISYQQYLTFLQSFGLLLNHETGGSQPNGPIDYKLESLGEAHMLLAAGADPILFLEPEMFLETVHTTESSLQVKLFN